MLISVRGTSGSGKTTILRGIMDLYNNRRSTFIEGRRQPHFYTMEHPHVGRVRPLVVLGHYETIGGGLDTVKSVAECYEMMRAAHATGADVLFEGILNSADVIHTRAMHQDGLPVLNLLCSTPLAECFTRIHARRRLKSDLAGKPYPGDGNPTNTTLRERSIAAAVRKLEGFNVPVMRGSNEEIMERIKAEFQL